MFLKSIEIFGFKSFADKSRIDFQDGISTIVGPNGCGKSNVIEAIRWVLGEQSSKGIRLEKMDNVIFNGTETRHPLNVAEVTLVFSNEQNTLPLEFSEVAIKRRIFRSSNSEYYINNTLVTLKELRELLADTGIGVTEYIVMEQGRIDQVLESKPLERRGVLEEAAGIKKYRMQSIEGTRRREKVKENIVQITQIVQEIEKQHKTLQKQSEKAILYRTLSEQVFSYEVTLVCKKYFEYTENLEAIKRKLEKEIKVLEKEEDVKIKLLEDSEGFYSEIKIREEELVELNKRLSIVRTERAGLKRMLQSNKEHIDEVTQQYDTYTKQIKNYTLREQECRKEIEAFAVEYSKQEKNLTATKDSITKNQQKTSQNEHKIAESLQNKVTLEQEEQSIRASLEEHQKELRTVIDRLAEELDKQIAQTGYSTDVQSSLERELGTIHTQLKKKTEHLHGIIKDSHAGKGKDVLKYAKELVEISSTITKKFIAYKKSVPSFLKDFLSNDGVLVHKT